ncbi:hypothetical protein [Paraglaciecola sp.]|uniref:hypothetical protein n=1 Tax=Paraglaciecola sp. TaxID=1920173 RepID=UPI003EF63D33
MKVLLSITLITALVGVIWFAQESNKTVEPVSVVQSPVISRHDILTATDFVAGIKNAVANNKQSDINKWIYKAVEVAEAAQLPLQDIQYIQSDLAKNFLVFQAKRQLFNEEIQQAYYAIEDITLIKERYPEAQNLYPKVDLLIKNRNKIIQQIALEMANGQEVNDTLLSAAKEKWKQQFRSQVLKLN